MPIPRRQLCGDEGLFRLATFLQRSAGFVNGGFGGEQDEVENTKRREQYVELVTKRHVLIVVTSAVRVASSFERKRSVCV
jgi:hypothetical protein